MRIEDLRVKVSEICFFAKQVAKNLLVLRKRKIYAFEDRAMISVGRRAQKSLKVLLFHIDSDCAVYYNKNICVYARAFMRI